MDVEDSSGVDGAWSESKQTRDCSLQGWFQFCIVNSAMADSSMRARGGAGGPVAPWRGDPAADGSR